MLAELDLLWYWKESTAYKNDLHSLPKEIGGQRLSCGEERALSCPFLFQDVCSGSEGAEGCPSPACAETSLLQSGSPSLWTPLGVIPVASGTAPSFT